MAFHADITVASASDLQEALNDTRATTNGSIAKTRRWRIACAWNGPLARATAAGIYMNGFASGDGWIDNGGVLLVEAAPGYRPALADPVFIEGARGLHLRGIGFARKWGGTAKKEDEFCAQVRATAQAPGRPLFRMDRCAIGAAFWGADIADCVNGLAVLQGTEWAGVYDTTFMGGENLAMMRAQRFEFAGCDFRQSKQDNINCYPHTGTPDYYQAGLIDRCTFRDTAMGPALADNHKDACQTGSGTDRHKGYRIKIRRSLFGLGHSHPGSGGTQGGFNDDHSLAESVFVMQDVIGMTASPAVHQPFSPQGVYPSFTDRCTFGRAGIVPDGEDNSPGFVMRNSARTNPAGARVSNSFVGMLPNGDDAIGLELDNVRVVNWKQGAAAGTRPEDVFKGRDFQRVGNNKLAYALPNEAGSQAQFVADMWANFEPIGGYAGQGAPDPRGYGWNAPVPL